MSELDALGRDFWQWRAAQQPRSRDDIPRIDRPAGWVADFSTDAVARYRSELTGFEEQLSRIDPENRAAQVDARLLRSAFARVRWELDVLRIWQRQPGFYVDQTLGCVFDLLTPLGVDAARLTDVTRLLAATPAILDVGRQNLSGHAVREFARLTISALTTVEDDVAATVRELCELRPQGWSDAANDGLAAAGRDAGRALGAFRDHLAAELSAMAAAEPVGAEDFGWFLREVAVVPCTPQELLDIGRREAERAAALELLERHRSGIPAGRAPAPRFATGDEQAAAETEAELAVRRFYEERDLLTQPGTLRHYRTHPMPAYLAPIAWLGVADDLTGPDRLDSDGSAFFPPPGPGLPYFYAANAHDPRAGIIHEGVHYQQLALSWRHPRPIRRHYYDSTANEGLAFYNEELMLASGLFDDAPETRVVVCNFMRLRALRVVVDVQLALGELDIEGAARLLETSVPMDRETALEEAAFFASTPGQALTYQVGKTQILGLLADASRRDGFSLRAFHDRLWLEGNVPISLQRWELLDDRSELDRIEALSPRSRPAPVPAAEPGDPASP